jgi:hypothetical protein
MQNLQSRTHNFTGDRQWFLVVRLNSSVVFLMRFTATECLCHKYTRICYVTHIWSQYTLPFFLINPVASISHTRMIKKKAYAFLYYIFSCLLFCIFSVPVFFIFHKNLFIMLRFCISVKVSSPKSRTSIFSSWRKISLHSKQYFSYIMAISWWSVLSMEEKGVSRKNHRATAY